MFGIARIRCAWLVLVALTTVLTSCAIPVVGNSPEERWHREHPDKPYPYPTYRHYTIKV